MSTVVEAAAAVAVDTKTLLSTNLLHPSTKWTKLLLLPVLLLLLLLLPPQQWHILMGQRQRQRQRQG